MASRYLATVRRAMSTPASFRISTMRSSDSTSPLAALGVDQLADLVAHAFGRMGLAAGAGGDRGGEEELHLEHAARRGQVLVRGHPADGGLVHADGVGHGLQVQRPQVLDAEGEEAVLLAHDLAGHLQDGLGALVEALHQPVGRGQAVGDEGLLLRRCARRRRPGRGSAGRPAAAAGCRCSAPPARGRPRSFAHEHVGHHRWRRLAAEGRAGPGRQRPQLGDHLAQVLVVDAAGLAAGRPCRAGPAGRDCRAAPPWPDRTGRAPSAAAPGIRRTSRAKTPVGSKPCSAASTGSSCVLVAAQPLGDLGQVGAQVAALVDRVDQHQRRWRARPPTRPASGSWSCRCSASVLARGVSRLRSSSPSKSNAAALAGRATSRPTAGVRSPAPAASPVPGRRGRRRRRGRRSRRRASASAGAASVRRSRARSRSASPRSAVACGSVGSSGAARASSRCSRGLRSSSASTIGLELEVGELQQLDRLLQLRRDDQALALPKLQSRAERQCRLPSWPVSCVTVGRFG